MEMLLSRIRMVQLECDSAELLDHVTPNPSFGAAVWFLFFSSEFFYLIARWTTLVGAGMHHDYIATKVRDL